MGWGWGRRMDPYMLPSSHEQEIQWRLGMIPSFMVPISGRNYKPDQLEERACSVARVFIYCSLGVSERNPGFWVPETFPWLQVTFELKVESELFDERNKTNERWWGQCSQAEATARPHVSQVKREESVSSILELVICPKNPKSKHIVLFDGKKNSAMLPIWEVEWFGDDLDIVSHCRSSIWLTYIAPTGLLYPPDPFAQCSHSTRSQLDMGASKIIFKRARLCEGANLQSKPHRADGRIVAACLLLGKATPSFSSPFQEPENWKGLLCFW